jgi:hypothetical protein
VVSAGAADPGDDVLQVIREGDYSERNEAIEIVRLISHHTETELPRLASGLMEIAEEETYSPSLREIKQGRRSIDVGVDENHRLVALRALSALGHRARAIAPRLRSLGDHPSKWSVRVPLSDEESRLVTQTLNRIELAALRVEKP